jgi:lipoyl-dependent peroxiredoxin
LKIFYTAEATAEGGRHGRSRTSDGAVDVHLVPPKPHSGPPKGTNPEQLFATGYAGCFQSAMQHVAREQGLSTEGSTVTAKVGIGPRDDGPGFGLKVDLEVQLPALDRETAEQLVATADTVCPYSNAVRGNIEVGHSVV